MQQAVIRCNGVQTHVMTEGRWIEEGLDPDGKKDVVIVIPGNSGVISFYEDFIKALKSKLPSETPVWLIGHAGHVLPSNDLWFSPDDKTDRNGYNLDGQRKHKIEFLKQYVPKDARIHIVSHSIGCWFALKLLDEANCAEQIHKCYLLFPTIERMAESPNGKIWTGTLLSIVPLILFISWLFALLPNLLKSFLIRVFGGFFGVTGKSVKPVAQLLNPPVLRRVFSLLDDELRQIKELDHDAIDRHAKKLFIYYATKDVWTPIRYYEEMKANHPNVDAELCQRGFRHAFVLTHNKEVGHMIGEKINATIT